MDVLSLRSLDHVSSFDREQGELAWRLSKEVEGKRVNIGATNTYRKGRPTWSQVCDDENYVKEEDTDAKTSTQALLCGVQVKLLFRPNWSNIPEMTMMMMMMIN